LTLLQKPEDWNTAKKEMADPIAFVQSLKRFDLTSVPAKNLKRCKALIKEFDMTFANVKRVSVAAANICKWVLACVACIDSLKGKQPAGITTYASPVKKNKVKAEPVTDVQFEAESPAESPSPNTSQKKKRRDRIVRGYDERTSFEVPPMR
jgi:hypothetical protein